MHRKTYDRAEEFNFKIKKHEGHIQIQETNIKMELIKVENDKYDKEKEKINKKENKAERYG
jgi:hypothetical protein